jgi:hemoglobin
MNGLVTISRSAGALAALALAAVAAVAQGPTDATLYQRLGALDGVATLADRLVDRIAADQVLQANPYVREAMARVARAGLKYRMTTMLCAAAGGPQAYAGRSMKDAHAHLRITGREWRAFHACLTATLEELAVGEGERAALLALLDPLAADIVVAGELDGRTCAGERGSGGEAAGVPDEISFADGRIASKADAANGFAPGVYAAAVTGQAIAFEAEAVGPGGARIAWKGTVEGGRVDATTVVSRPDGGVVARGWFRGRVTP